MIHCAFEWRICFSYWSNIFVFVFVIVVVVFVVVVVVVVVFWTTENGANDLGERHRTQQMSRSLCRW